MNWSRVRVHAVGEDAGAVWSGVAIGILLALPVVWLFRLFNWLLLDETLYGLAFAAVALLIAVQIVDSGGGILAIGLGLLFPIGAVVWAFGRSVPVLPATVAAIVAAGVAYVVLASDRNVWTTARRILHSLTTAGDHDRDRSGSGRQQAAAATESPTDDDGEPSPGLVRRRVLFAGGLGAAATGFGVVHGWVCSVSPANCRIFANASRMIVRVQVFRYGLEVFHTEVELGDDTERSRSVEFDSAVPIGCSLPEDVTVVVETSDGHSVTETVTFPAVDRSFDGTPGQATLEIRVALGGVEVEAHNHGYRSAVT